MDPLSELESPDDDLKVRTSFIKIIVSFLTVLDKKKNVLGFPIPILKLHTDVLKIIWAAKTSSPRVQLYIELARVISNAAYLFEDEPVISLDEIKEASQDSLLAQT